MQVADQLLVGLGLVQQALLAILPGLRLQRQQFNDRLAGDISLRHHDMHWHGFTIEAPEPCVIPQGSEFVASGSIERMLEQQRLGKTVG